MKIANCLTKIKKVGTFDYLGGLASSNSITKHIFSVFLSYRIIGFEIQNY
jgi:hypothetical protein